MIAAGSLGKQAGKRTPPINFGPINFGSADAAARPAAMDASIPARAHRSTLVPE